MTNANSKESVDKKFSGKPGKGLTFQEFDLKVLSWARKQYGNSYAKPLWENSLPDIYNLDLRDDLDHYVFEEHCEFVYDVLGHESTKHADTLYHTAKFWTVKWQVENRQRQYEKLFCYLETICEDEAQRQLYAQGVEMTKGLRKYFFERFGAGQPDVLQERVRKYMLAMPNSNGVAFPLRVNMPEKLDQLEEERNYLLRMCPKELHKDYDEGKETTLVRNILNALPAEYDDAVQNVRNLVRIREMIKSGNIDLVTNVDDAIKINYDTTWLPPYSELRVGLVNAYLKMKKRWDENQSGRNKVGHPVMMLEGDVKKDKRCYGCGELGHMRGADECRASRDAIWGGAPKAYLEKVQRRFGKTPSGDKRPISDESKTPCPYWSSGDGYCKFGERCKFDHSGPQGGSKRARDFGKGGKGKGKGKSKGKGRGRGGGKGRRTSLVVQKKNVKFSDKLVEGSSSMLIGRREGEEKEDESDVEEELYNLMRGNTSMMITANAGDSDDSDDLGESDGESVEDFHGNKIEDDSDEESGDEEKSDDEDKFQSSSVDQGKGCPNLEESLSEKLIRLYGSSSQKREEPDSPKLGSTGKAPYTSTMEQISMGKEERDRRGSPPPKLNTESASHANRPTSQTQEWGQGNGPLVPDPNYAPTPWRRFEWDQTMDEEGPEPEPTSWGRSRPKRSSSPSSSSSSSSDDGDNSSWALKHQSSGKDVDDDSESEESDGEESSSEGEDEDEPPMRNKDPDDSDSDDGTIGQIFKEIRNGTFDTKKRRKRFEGSSSYLEEEDGRDVATREDCNVTTAEALYRLTKNERDKWDDDDEWVIIKVPKKKKNWFYVDYCDGDTEDEFHWLEGPYLQEYLTIEDLIDRRRSQTRTSRRRRGVAEFRDDEALDKRDKDENLIPSWPYNCCGRQRPQVFKQRGKHRREYCASQPTLCYLCHHEIYSDLSAEYPKKSELATSLNGKEPQMKSSTTEEAKPRKRNRNNRKHRKQARTALMTIKNGQQREAPLHDMTYVGIDTCSARSISCEREDFLHLEISHDLRESEVLRGVGGISGVTGKGVLVFYAKDIDGKVKAIIEPKGVYLADPPAKFRILGQQKMKENGITLIQDYDDEGTDILKCKRSGSVLPLEEGQGILLLKTFRYQPNDELKQKLKDYVGKLLNRKSLLPHMIDLEELNDGVETVLIMNEGKLKKENYERLLHWRFGHCSTQVLKAMDLIENSHLNEDCYCCNQGKFKRQPFPKNEGAMVAVAEPFFRLYIDGFGGQRSLGSDSLEGAKGGIVAVCPISGSIIIKLYSTMKQFPAILYQILQYVESQGFVCREVMVDTYVVNLSSAAEDVAAMFKTRLIPISAGTPQELAYAERAVRTMGDKARTMLLGAQHLPKCMWGLTYLYSAYIHDVLPQKERGNMSPYEFRHRRQPNIDHLHIKVFGCPCQFSPMDAPAHKTASKTEWGYFVGMQWPMCLVYQPNRHKVLSVSRKKIVCHEGVYANFDPTSANLPRANIAELDPTLEMNRLQEDEKQDMSNSHNDTVKGVHSIKVLRDFELNSNFNEPLPQPPLDLSSSPSQPENQGENSPQLGSFMDEDSLLEKIRQHKENEQVKTFEYGADISARNILQKRRTTKDQKRKRELAVGDKVRIKTWRFGTRYAKGKPEYSEGQVVSIKGSKAGVRYKGEKKIYDTNKAHLEKVQIDPEQLEDVVATVIYKGKRYKKSQTFYSIMASLEVGSALKRSEENEETSWPKDFFEALVRNDWRDWVMAVQKENESWRTFDASGEVRYEDMERGASIIPLGELYTIKRNGQHKFRQYAMGNLLKAGKDYGDTFSSTVSGDGLRWFCALAAACNMRIRGWDATTGYLQTKQRIKIYAYLPSHYGYSDMEMEELAEFRKLLLGIMKNNGIKGIKDYSRQRKKENRWKPKVVLELKSSTYGIPDAGQAFAMFMQGLHIKKCGLTQCEVDPAIYFRIDETPKKPDKDSTVKDFLIAITWVDDVRYFGTAKFVNEYEESIKQNCKCTMEGDSSEFVSIEIKQDLQRRTLELTQQVYWEKAVERFAEFLPIDKVKERRVPLSAMDEKMLTEPTEEEMKEAEHLPYPNLLGVVQYPSSFTKPEMRFAMSVLSRHRTKWGKKHFVILLKSLEYGYSTRTKGIIYTGNLRKEDLNILVAYADSSLSIPRSQGCRMVIMNGAVISFTSKRHSTTDDSTAAAELTEQHLCACDVEGLRNLMKEVGLEQLEPTKIFQDNQAAIHIANNRGALAKKTRAMDMRTLTVRNKVEDMKVIPIYCETIHMLADIGTKALEPARFEILRDIMTGYAVLEAMRKGNFNEVAVLLMRMARRSV